jgi:hypothetical protein
VADLSVNMILAIESDEEDIPVSVMGGAGSGSGFDSKGRLLTCNSLQTAASIVRAS